MRKFSKSNLETLVRSISMPVYAPVEKENLVLFERLEGGETIRLDKTSTDKSPKDVLFPQWEDLMQFRLEGKTIELTEQQRCEEDFVVFGIRACDLQAFEVLDKVFLAEPVDTFYAARREHGIMVALACGNPEQSCFCTVFGVDPAQPKADIVLWEVGEEIYCNAYTAKGEKLMTQWATETADDAPVEAEKKNITAKIAAQPFASMKVSTFTEKPMMEIFNSPKWDKLSMACLGCGSCTFSCPTCQCYDIRDYNGANGIQRYRCWDSCMYSDFTLMAATNPRTTQKQRYRQRFMHKLVYFPENNGGMFSCVGCGRCVRKCPMNLNIAKVIKAFGEDKK